MISGLQEFVVPPTFFFFFLSLTTFVSVSTSVSDV